MSKSATSDSRLSRAGHAGWLLAQTFWVGGLWLLQFVVLPALERIGLAPLLVEEIGQGLRPLLIGFAAFCMTVQALVLTAALGMSSLWRDRRGQLLLMALVLAVGHLSMAASATGGFVQQWLSFSYLAAAACGVLLVMQRAPAEPACSGARQAPA